MNLPPEINLKGEIYKLRPTGDIADTGFSTTFGYIVDGSEKDMAAAFVIVGVSGTCLQSWIGQRAAGNPEAKAKVQSTMSAVMSYIEIPLSLEDIRSRYPQGLGVMFTSDRNGFSEKEFTYYIPNSFNPAELAEKMIFQGKITQPKIEDRLLRLVARYREWDYENDPPSITSKKGEMPYQAIIDMLLVPESKIRMALDVLNEERLIDINATDQAIVGVTIKAPGIRKLENEVESPIPKKQVTFGYVSEEIVNGFNSKKDDLKYSKLIGLITELNDNWERQNPYSTASSLRAVLDHIPPLLAQKNWDGIVNNYKWEQSDKKYIRQLDDFRAIADEGLHRPIGSRNLREINMVDIPAKRNLEIVLQECLDADLDQLREMTKQEKQTKPKSSTKQVPHVQIMDKLSWANWGGFASGFLTKIKVNNYGGEEDYLTEVVVHATEGNGQPWPAKIYQIEVHGDHSRKLQPGEELYIGKNKIVNASLFITDEMNMQRQMPDLDVDTVKIEFKFSSGKIIDHTFKPGDVGKHY
jgi:hypothetical protein